MERMNKMKYKVELHRYPEYRYVEADTEEEARSKAKAQVDYSVFDSSVMGGC